jgi:hypothetical protein
LFFIIILLFHSTYADLPQFNFGKSSTIDLTYLFFEEVSGLGQAAISLSVKQLVIQVKLFMELKLTTNFLMDEFSYDYLESLTS